MQGFENQQLQIQVFSMAGQLMLTEVIDHDGGAFVNTNINIAQLPAGAYLLKLQGAERVWTRELIKQ